MEAPRVCLGNKFPNLLPVLHQLLLVIEAKIEKRERVHLERLAYDIVLLGTCATHAYTPGLNGVHHVQKDWKAVVKRPLNSEEHVARPLLPVRRQQRSLLGNTRVIERECCVFLL
eukprot:scaffold110_cov315-Pavlova_lutheri.AAC.5